VKIRDFGEKIEGAKKDLIAVRNGRAKLTGSMVSEWKEREREDYINKDLVWKKMNYPKMYESGMDRELVYFIKTIRDALPVRPENTDLKTQCDFVDFVSAVRDETLKMKNMSDVPDFKQNVIKHMRTYNSCPPSLKSALSNDLYTLRKEIDRKEFLYTEEEKVISRYIACICSPSELADFEFLPLPNYNKAYIRLSMKDTPQSHDSFCVTGYTGTGELEPIVNLKKEDFQEDKFFIIGRDKTKPCSHGLLGKDYNTREEAEFIAKAFAKVMEQKRKEEEEKKYAASQDDYKNRKKEQLVPPQLKEVEREANGIPQRENDASVTPKEFLDIFKVRGVQFGNWTNQNDRQTSIDYFYDAFRDLAVALEIPYEDVSLIHSNPELKDLSIAYGARGSGKAAAHFEPKENVINLTKENGAGFLAHEWGHALDCFVKDELGSALKPKDSERRMASHCRSYDNNVVNPFEKVIETIRWKRTPEGYKEETDFYGLSKKTDKVYEGYWATNCEMFARAFACYVNDKLQEQGINSYFLCGQSDFAGNPVPQGEERKTINAAIENMIGELKEMGLLRHQTHDIAAEMRKDPKLKYLKTPIAEFKPILTDCLSSEFKQMINVKEKNLNKEDVKTVVNFKKDITALTDDIMKKDSSLSKDEAQEIAINNTIHERVKNACEYLDSTEIKTIGELATLSLSEFYKLSNTSDAVREDILSGLESIGIALSGKVIEKKDKNKDKDKDKENKKDEKEVSLFDFENNNTEKNVSTESNPHEDTTDNPKTPNEDLNDKPEKPQGGFTQEEVTAAPRQMSFFEESDMADLFNDSLNFEDVLKQAESLTFENTAILEKENFDLEDKSMRNNVTFSANKIAFDYNNNPIIRSDFSECLTNITDEQQKDLLSRCGIDNETEREQISSCDLKLYVDSTFEKAEGVLEASKKIGGITTKKEFSFKLSSKETQYICEAAEKELGYSLSEELENVQESFFKDFEEEHKERDKYYGYI